jgi:2-oxoglutarate dehydrogenase E2 component (dihydrolipoamide succinyltransferase)
MTSIQMPQLGETIVEGTILRWLKREGEHVERDEPIFEISTDKVDTEVPSPVSGTVTKILVEEGATVPVGTPLMEIEGLEATPSPEAPVADVSVADAAEPAPTPAPAERGPRSQVLSPMVRKLAAEHGVDLGTVTGTGAGGRITKQDVLDAAGRPPSTKAASSAIPATPAPLGAASGDVDVQPVSHIRKAIAQHMLASVNETARAWTSVEVNVENLVRLRERSKDSFVRRHGVKLTFLPMVVRAAVDALREFPMVNSRLEGENIVTPRFVNMGIAVSYDAGLIVPVVKGADAMSIVGIAQAIADLAARARSHQLKPDEVQGATFTITNPGPYGSLISVPIINQPNAGILSLDAIQKRPVVVEDDAIAVRHMVYVSMSWDHRVIDGELATRFLARVKHNLETWDFAEDLEL